MVSPNEAAAPSSMMTGTLCMGMARELRGPGFWRSSRGAVAAASSATRQASLLDRCKYLRMQRGRSRQGRG